MISARRIFKNTMALAIAKLLNLANSVLMAWLIARTLQATGLGVFSIIMAFFSTLSRWADLGISNFIPRDVSRDLSKTNRYTVHLGLLSVFVTLIIVVLLYIFTPVFHYSAETTLGIYIIGLALIPTAMLVILDATIVTHERAELITYSQIIENIGDIVGTIYLLTNGYGVIAVIVNYTIFRYVTLIVRGYSVFRYIIIPRWEVDFSFFKRLVNDLKTFTLLGILSGFSSQTEVIILSLLGTVADVGFYSAALKFITFWYIIPDSFMGVVFPLFSKSFEQSPDSFKEIQNKAIKYLMTVALPLGIGMLAVGDQMIRIFYGPGFESSVPVLRTLAWMPVLIFLNGVLWRTLLARNQQHLALRVAVIGLLVRVVTSYWFIRWLDYFGAALALTSNYIFFALFHLYYVWRGGTPVPFFRITWRFIVAATIMGVLSWFLGHAMGFHLLINIPISASVYVGLVYLLRGFAQDDIELFRSVIRRRAKAPAQVSS